MPRDTICARESRRWLAPPRHKEDKFIFGGLAQVATGVSRVRISIPIARLFLHTYTDTHADLYSTILLSPHGNKDKHARQSYVLSSFLISTKQVVLSITDLVQEKNLAWMRGLPRGLRGSDGMSPHYSAKSPRLHSQLTCITCTIYFCAVKAWDTM